MKLEISFQQMKNNYRSYAIVDTDTDITAVRDSNAELLKSSMTKNLLNFYEVDLGSHYQIWYDISGKRSLKESIEAGDDADYIIKLVKDALIGLAIDSDISADHVLLTPDTVFIKNGEIYFMYFPIEQGKGLKSMLQNFRDKLSSLKDADSEQNEEPGRFLVQVTRDGKTVDSSVEDEIGVLDLIGASDGNHQIKVYDTSRFGYVEELKIMIDSEKDDHIIATDSRGDVVIDSYSLKL